MCILESVNEYAMRLRTLAEHCKFDAMLDKEIERQFVVSCGMPEVERECVRTDDLTLAKVLTMAGGYERSANNLKGLRQPTEFSNHINYTSSRDWKDSRSNEESNKASGSNYGSRHGNGRGSGSGYGHGTGSGYGQDNGRNNTNNNASKCSKCGRIAHKSDEKCLAEKAECYKCKKTGHYSKQCRNQRRSRVKVGIKRTTRPEMELKGISVK